MPRPRVKMTKEERPPGESSPPGESMELVHRPVGEATSQLPWASQEDSTPVTQGTEACSQVNQCPCWKKKTPSPPSMPSRSLPTKNLTLVFAKPMSPPTEESLLFVCTAICFQTCLLLYPWGPRVELDMGPISVTHATTMARLGDQGFLEELILS